MVGLARDNGCVFLLGAGASLHAGMPSAEQTTRCVMSSRAYEVSARYIMAGEGDGPGWDAFVLTISCYVRRLCELAKEYYQRSPTYEDLYYLAEQIAEHEKAQHISEEGRNPDRGLYNPLIMPAAKHMRQRLSEDAAANTPGRREGVPLE